MVHLYEKGWGQNEPFNISAKVQHGNTNNIAGYKTNMNQLERIVLAFPLFLKETIKERKKALRR